MAVVLILVSLVFILIALWYKHYYNYEKYLRNIPGPRPLPILGNALDFGPNADVLWKALEFSQAHGEIVKTYLGFNEPSLLITNDKLIEAVLGSSKLIEKSPEYRYFFRWLGTGLLTSGSNKWKKHRKMLTPAFHFKILEEFLDVFEVYSNILIKKLENEVDKNSIDIYPYITLCSLDIICASSMGTKVNAQENTESEYVRSVKSICKVIFQRIVSAIKSTDVLYKLTKDFRDELKALNVLHKYTMSVITARKKEFTKSNLLNDNLTDDLGIKKKLTFLDLMLKYKFENNDISDDEIRQEVDTFMFEGHDTTSSGISFALYCLATNPEVQEKVMQELNILFENDKSRCATNKDLQEMKYLEMVIKEALRLYPPVPMYGRSVQEAFTFEGLEIPEGTVLTAFAFGLHRNPRLYPDPEKFDPERFSLENLSKRSPYAYIPFSAGPRNCIVLLSIHGWYSNDQKSLNRAKNSGGPNYHSWPCYYRGHHSMYFGQKFAMLEMKSVISKILRNYELLPSIPHNPPKVIGEIILKSATGVNLRLQRRN